ncbi:Lsr2 family protein [Dactylosporangium sp. NPDC050688]|uniref:histone-like nucleoid-structuring protein Lsr2 n=1 Tax=Dactylosporangium sp. NPDC050688 TaxID=3157217 RepID=UPI00340D4B47
MKRTIHVLEDDLDGGSADETVLFELDGTAYTIDLSAANTAALRETLDPFVRAATIIQPQKPVWSGPSRDSQRRTSRGGSDRAGGPDQRRPDAAQRRADNTAIREWGRAAGYDVRDLGRISSTLVAAYHRAAAVPGPPPQ